MGVARKGSKKIEIKKLHRGVEQLVARRAHNPKVVGSSPAPATKKESGFYRIFCFKEIRRL